ncbi:MAG: hypothetical protein K2J78_01970 [Muribaculaceae bacterium]|nr:hypothetical protein [Muribaculaceae bacterium]
MKRTIDVGNLHCLCSSSLRKDRIAYILYPMDILDDWIEPAAKKYDTTIVVVTGMDWQNVFSPWAAPGVPKGMPTFKGEAPEFLTLLQQKVMSEVEKALGLSGEVERSLIGVSMSGLFALWQWILCDTFYNIASLSGSFWYEGFLDWMNCQPIPTKQGKGYFLLGNQELKSKAKVFGTVGENTQEIISILRGAGIDVEFQLVPGNHHSDPLSRLDKAFFNIFSE